MLFNNRHSMPWNSLTKAGHIFENPKYVQGIECACAKATRCALLAIVGKGHPSVATFNPQDSSTSTRFEIYKTFPSHPHTFYPPSFLLHHLFHPSPLHLSFHHFFHPSPKHKHLSICVLSSTSTFSIITWVSHQSSVIITLHREHSSIL